MTFDAHQNFAASTVATAPSPATSGTSLVVATGDGSKFPAVPFNVVVCPANTNPTPANAEIVRVTAVSTDSFTITRAQEGSSARSIQIGDQIFNAETAKTFTDIESQIGPLGQVGFTSGDFYSCMYGGSGSTTAAPIESTEYAVPFFVRKAASFQSIACYLQTAGSSGAVGRLGLRQDSGGCRPSTLILDGGTVDLTTGAGAQKLKAISQALPSGLVWVTFTLQGGSVTRPILLSPPVAGAPPALGLLGVPTSVDASVYAYTQTGVTGALPGSFTVAGHTNNFAPWLWLQAA